jgi:hypothetical protein
MNTDKHRFKQIKKEAENGNVFPPHPSPFTAFMGTRMNADEHG